MAEKTHRQKRVIWLWVAHNANRDDYQRWQQFVRVNMSISEHVRFLVADTLDAYERKRDILRRAGWQEGRWGEGWMERVVSFTKISDDDTD
ncbi:MAG: hypothetical protein AAFR81_02325 [Chloroflexota bacterium]